MGPAVGRRRDRPSPLDGVQGAPRHGSRAPPAARGSAAIRVAVPGRSPAHGHQALRALLRPGHAVTGDRSKDGALDGARGSGMSSSTPSSMTTPAWPTSSCIADERAETVTGVRRARPRLVPATASRAKRLMTDNAWSYTKNQSLRELLARHEHPPPAARGPTGPGPTARSNASTRRWPRMGIRHHLPLTAPPQPKPCHTGSSTTTAQTPQLTRRPATDQPRSQPPWARQLGGGVQRHGGARRAPSAPSRRSYRPRGNRWRAGCCPRGWS